MALDMVSGTVFVTVHVTARVVELYDPSMLKSLRAFGAAMVFCPSLRSARCVPNTKDRVPTLVKVVISKWNLVEYLTACDFMIF